MTKTEYIGCLCFFGLFFLLAIFVKGHLVTISVISFSILTTGFRGDVVSFLYGYIREAGHTRR